MLSYENPAGDFQGITYETPRSGKSFKKPPENLSSGGFEKATWYRENRTYLRRFSLEIRER